MFQITKFTLSDRIIYIECTYIKIEDIVMPRQNLRAVKVRAIWWSKGPCSFWYTIVLLFILYIFVYFIFMTSPLWLALGPQSSIGRFISIHASSFLHQISYSPTNDHLFANIWAWEEWGTYVMDLVSRDPWGTRQEIKISPYGTSCFMYWRFELYKQMIQTTSGPMFIGWYRYPILKERKEIIIFDHLSTMRHTLLLHCFIVTEISVYTLNNLPDRSCLYFWPKLVNIRTNVCSCIATDLYLDVSIFSL